MVHDLGDNSNSKNKRSNEGQWKELKDSWFSFMFINWIAAVCIFSGIALCVGHFSLPLWNDDEINDCFSHDKSQLYVQRNSIHSYYFLKMIENDKKNTTIIAIRSFSFIAFVRSMYLQTKEGKINLFFKNIKHNTTQRYPNKIK